MTGPVFVIHGVGSRDQRAFKDRVADLRKATGRRWDMRAVYWGDLGADDRWVDLTVPSRDERRGPAGAGVHAVRDGGEPPRRLPDQTAVLAAALLAAPQPASDESMVRDGLEAGRLRLVMAAAVERLAAGSAEGVEIRDGGDVDVAQAEAVREAIAEHWESTTWLRQVSDPLLLEEIGSAIAAPLADPDLAIAQAGEEIRGLDIGGFVQRRLTDLDRVVGAAIGAAAGRLNTYLRTEQGPGVARFFGDILVYQRRRQEIHERVWATIGAVHPVLGRDPAHPVRVIGHSLGGVIAVDMAIADQPLWTSSLVTFGSQSPFFHVCDPRGGQLLPFEGAQLVQLPRSVGAWTNLWEPMDVLAFIAANVFRMHDGSAPIDLPVPHLLSSGLWTHSAYWQSPEVVSAIQKAFDMDEAPL